MHTAKDYCKILCVDFSVFPDLFSIALSRRVRSLGSALGLSVRQALGALRGCSAGRLSWPRWVGSTLYARAPRGVDRPCEKFRTLKS